MCLHQFRGDKSPPTRIFLLRNKQQWLSSLFHDSDSGVNLLPILLGNPIHPNVHETKDDHFTLCLNTTILMKHEGFVVIHILVVEIKRHCYSPSFCSTTIHSDTIG